MLPDVVAAAAARARPPLPPPPLFRPPAFAAGLPGPSSSSASSSSPASVSSSPAGLRSRHTFTLAQRDALEAVFRVQPYIDSGTRLALADRLGLSEKQVRTWFDNRRRLDKIGASPAMAEDV